MPCKGKSVNYQCFYLYRAYFYKQTVHTALISQQHIPPPISKQCIPLPSLRGRGKGEGLCGDWPLWGFYLIRKSQGTSAFPQSSESR